MTYDILPDVTNCFILGNLNFDISFHLNCMVVKDSPLISLQQLSKIEKKMFKLITYSQTEIGLMLPAFERKIIQRAQVFCTELFKYLQLILASNYIQLLFSFKSNLSINKS